MVPITCLSDYGHRDEWVGTCHGVIARLAPEIRVIDLTHGVPRHDVRRGAILLRDALPYVPPGVHLAVVDPQVGATGPGARRAVALRASDGRLLVGPDNGLLVPAAEAGGGVVEAVDLGRSPWRLEPVSATFHGRDVFAPVAARLAAGGRLAEAGEPVEPDELARLEFSRARLEGVELVVHALWVDGFGNVGLDAMHEDLTRAGLRLGERLALACGNRVSSALYAGTFADVPPGDAIVYEDAARTLAVAVNRGSAAELLGLSPAAELRLRPA